MKKDCEDDHKLLRGQALQQATGKASVCVCARVRGVCVPRRVCVEGAG